MKKRLFTILLAATVACTVFAGCGSKDSDTKKESLTTGLWTLDGKSFDLGSVKFWSEN